MAGRAGSPFEEVTVAALVGSPAGEVPEVPVVKSRAVLAGGSRAKRAVGLLGSCLVLALAGFAGPRNSALGVLAGAVPMCFARRGSSVAASFAASGAAAGRELAGLARSLERTVVWAFRRLGVSPALRPQARERRCLPGGVTC